MSNRSFFDDDGGNNGFAPPPVAPSNGKAIASLVIAIVCILLIWTKFLIIFIAPVFIVANIIGIILAISARNANAQGGHPTALANIAMILNILSLIVYILTFIACTVCVACAFSLF